MAHRPGENVGVLFFQKRLEPLKIGLVPTGVMAVVESADRVIPLPLAASPGAEPRSPEAGGEITAHGPGVSAAGPMRQLSAQAEASASTAASCAGGRPSLSASAMSSSLRAIIGSSSALRSTSVSRHLANMPSLGISSSST